jgi:hypothetical protein
MRFETDAKFKGAVTIGLVALLGLSGLLWCNANGFARLGSPVGNPASAAHVQAPSPAIGRNAVADVPV